MAENPLKAFEGQLKIQSVILNRFNMNKSHGILADKSKLTVMIFTGYYLPGFKGGGPIRTIANMVAKLGDEIQFHLVTSDRDLGEHRAYKDVVTNAWQPMDHGYVYYASPGTNWLLKLWALIRAFDGHALYLNSFFSLRFSILPLTLWHVLRRGRPIILGPRGEFSRGALAFKASKKRIFIELVKVLGLYRRIIWHASTMHEADDIRRVMGSRVRIRIAMDIADSPPVLVMQSRQQELPLRLLFVSRISPMKNLLGAIQMLKEVRVPVTFDVYGPVEDAQYWASCQRAIRQLPVHIQVNYRGPLYPAQVPEVMAQYDLFYLPTLGENFGHVIAEALGCGLPVLIADTTPWRGLAQQKLGWDLPLNRSDQFVAAIETCSRTPSVEYDAWRRNVRSWAIANIGNNEAIEQNRQLFMNLDSSYEH